MATKHHHHSSPQMSIIESAWLEHIMSSEKVIQEQKGIVLGETIKATCSKKYLPSKESQITSILKGKKCWAIHIIKYRIPSDYETQQWPRLTSSPCIH